MAIFKTDILDIELNSGSIARSFLNHTIGAGDSKSNRFGVRLLRNGEPENIGGTCSGYFIRADGETVVIADGIVNGNEAYVELPEACYAIEGQFTLAIKLIGGGATGTMRIVDGVVSRTTTDEIVDPGTLIPSIDDLIDAIDEATANIPQDYSVATNSLFASFGIKQNQYITFDYDNKTITFPTGTFLYNNAISKAFGQEQTIDLSLVSTSAGAWVLFVTATGTIYAVGWSNAHSQSTNDHFLGYIYDKYVFINGVGASFINVVNSNGIRIDLPSQTGTYLATYNGAKVVYDRTEKTITIPQAFYVWRGLGFGMPTGGYQIDVGSLSAGLLYIRSNGTIYVTAFNARSIQNYNDECIGYFYNNLLFINGIPMENIQVISNGSMVAGTYYSPGIIGLAQNSGNIIYNYTTKILTIPPAFTSYRGKGIARGSTVTIDVTNVLYSEACFLFAKQDGTIYAVTWNGCYAENPTDQFVGYIFRKQVVIFGVNPSQISVIDESTDKVFCFGDSITAGVGTSKLYHMFWHDYNPNLQFHNWGIGSTGYVLEWTGTAVVGGGVIGDGTSQSVSGNNNVLKVMQGVSGAMPNICIFSGTNDYGNNIALDTFRTAVQNTLDYALTKTAKVLVITPIKRNGWATTENSRGLLLKDYSDVIKEECEARGIICFDGYNVGLNPSIEGIRTAFMQDGLHPNENGQTRIARAINDKMLEAFCR